METKNNRNRFEKRASFPLGSVYITRGASAELCKQEGPAGDEEVREAIARHMRGDWGDVCDADWQENDFSVTNGFRILSSYRTKAGIKFWIITEADRSATTILLPEEY